MCIEEDIEEQGIEVLTDAIMLIKHQRVQHAMQDAHTMHDFKQLGAPAPPPFPVNVAAVQGTRSASNPEQGQSQPQGGPPRHLPAPPGQFPGPQIRFPLQRLTPSTEFLEHVHPGSTSRGDFHSDPEAHNAIETYIPGPSGRYVALPSRGLPGPFTYRPLPLPNQSIPIVAHRIENFGGNLPKGKRNPKKKSSDDARMVSAPPNDQRQASNGANATQLFAPRNVQMPFHSQSPVAIPLVPESCSSGAVAYSGNHHQPSLLPGRDLGSMQETFHNPPYHRQAPMQPSMEGRARFVSNPYSSTAHEMQGPTQDPSLTLAIPSVSTDMKHQGATTKGQLFEEHGGYVSTRVQWHISHPLDPHAFGHYLPDSRMSGQDRYNPHTDFERPALAPRSNAGQSPFPGTPRRHVRANDTLKYSVPEGCTIWIGGLPNEFDRSAVMHLLRPCRGLLNVTPPRVSWHQKNNTKHSHAFARYVLSVSNIVCNTKFYNPSFMNPVDAAEALQRLPQTRFAELPEGAFLSTNYAKHKLYASPGHHQYGSNRDPKPPASDVSPTKSRKGEDSNGAGKTRNEHSRKTSKGSIRVKKHSTSSSGGGTARSSKSVIAMDEGQKESDMQPEEGVAIPDLSQEAESMTPGSQSYTDGQEELKLMSQDLGIVPPDVGVEAHANQLSRITGDEAQEIALAPSAKPQKEGRQATSSTHTRARPKAAKNKSKGSNKLPMPEDRGPEPLTVEPVYEHSKPTARTQPSANEASRPLKNSDHPEDDKEKRGRSGVEASRMATPTVPFASTLALQEDLQTPEQAFLGRNPTEDDGEKPAPTVPFESNLVLQKNLQTPEQSFLGCNPTEDDGEKPKASVVIAADACRAKDDTLEVSEIAPAQGDSVVSVASLEPPKEQMSQEELRRDVSIPTQTSTDIAPSILSSTVPPSSSPTERSRSLTQEKRYAIVQAACSLSTAALSPGSLEPGGIAPQPKPENLKSLTPSETGKGTDRIQEALQKPTYGESGGFRPGPIEENPEQNPSILSVHLPSSNSDRAFSRSPAHKRTPSITARSSSLAVPSTPIKTHRKKKKKKKPRKFASVNEAPGEDEMSSPSKGTSLALEGTDVDSSIQTIEGTKPNASVLTIDPAACILSTEKLKGLPKPETPFLMDDGVRVVPPKLSCQTVMEPSSADQYYTQKSHCQIYNSGSAMHFNSTSDRSDYYRSMLPLFSKTSTPGRALAEKQDNDLETTLREAGYRTLSGTSPFTITDLELAFLDTIVEQGNTLENRNNKDGQVLSWLDDNGKMAPGMSYDAWNKQNEMIEVVQKATAVKRLVADSRAWTKVELLQQKLSQFVVHFGSDTQEQLFTKANAPQILSAKSLLHTIPQHNSSTSEMQKWSNNATLFLEEYASEPSPAVTTSRKLTTNSPCETSQGTSSRKQQQDCRHPKLINKPDPLNFVHQLGKNEDTFRTTSTELSDHTTGGQITESESSPSTFGRRTPSEERLTPSVPLIPSATVNQTSHWRDAFVETGEDCQRGSDDRHPVSTPQEEERMMASDPELKASGRELDVRKVTGAKDVEPGVKETENELQKKPNEDEQSESKGSELSSEDEKPDHSVTTKSEDTNDSTPAESMEEAHEKAEDLTLNRGNSQPLQVSYSSIDSHFTTSDEGNSEEAQHNRPRGGQSPLKRSGYNAVAGRGTVVKRGAKKEGSKDPWALPQGEKPWGSGGEGQGEKRKRQRH